jgi:hypothetical protein
MQLGDQGAVLVGQRDNWEVEGGHGFSIDQYWQGRGIRGVSGTPLYDPEAGHPYYKNQAKPAGNMDYYTTPYPYLVDYGPFNKPFWSKCFVIQLQIDPTARQGYKTSNPFLVPTVIAF